MADTSKTVEIILVALIEPVPLLDQWAAISKAYPEALGI